MEHREKKEEIGYTGENQRIQQILHSMAQTYTKQGEPIFPRAFVGGTLQENGEILVAEDALNIVTRIADDFETLRNTFEQELDYPPIKKAALETAQALWEEISINFSIKNNRPVNEREVKKWMLDIKKKLNREYPDLASFIQAMIPRKNSYNQETKFGLIFLVTYYCGLKTALHRKNVRSFIQEKHPSPKYEYDSETTPKRIQNTLLAHDDTSPFFGNPDVKPGEYTEQEFMTAVKHIIDPENKWEKLLEESVFESRHKSLISIVKKIFKSPEKVDDVVTQEAHNDDFGIRIGSYIDKIYHSTKMMEEYINNEVPYLQATYVDKGYQSMDTKNQDTSHHLFAFSNLKIYYHESPIAHTPAKMSPFAEVQVIQLPKVMYAQLYKEMHKKGIIQINKSKQTITAQPDKKKEYIMYLTKHMNDLQHYIYDIQKNRRLAYLLERNADLLYKNTNYNAAHSFIGQQISQAQQYIYTRLQKDLTNIDTTSYIVKQLGLNYAVLFPGFKGPQKAEAYEAILEILYEEIASKSTKTNHESDLLLMKILLDIKLTRKQEERKQDTSTNLMSILKINSDPRRKNIE